MGGDSDTLLQGILSFCLQAITQQPISFLLVLLSTPTNDHGAQAGYKRWTWGGRPTVSSWCPCNCESQRIFLILLLNAWTEWKWFPCVNLMLDCKKHELGYFNQMTVLYSLAFKPMICGHITKHGIPIHSKKQVSDVARLTIFCQMGQSWI